MTSNWNHTDLRNITKYSEVAKKMCSNNFFTMQSTQHEALQEFIR